MRARPIGAVLLCLFAAGCSKKEKSTAELLADLKGSDPKEKLIAVRLLPSRKTDASDVIPALIEALQDKSDDVRISAAIGLGSFGQQAKDAVPALQKAQKDNDARVREAARVALSRIDPSAAPKTPDRR
jgi:hypothetical protein